MKTNVTQTSLLAYNEVKKKRLGRNQILVLVALSDIAPATNKMVAKHLGWEINSITPRMKELREAHKVVEAYKAHDSSGRLAIYWMPKTQEQEADVA